MNLYTYFRFYLYIDQTEKYHGTLKATPVSKIWGIGSNLNKSLKERAIYTAYDLMISDPRWIRQKYNVIVERTVRELGGFSCMPLLNDEPKKSIQITRSLANPVRDLDTLKQAIARYAFRLAHKLRKSGLKTTTLWVYGRNSRFRDEPLAFCQKTITLDLPTNDTITLVSKAQSALEGFFDANVGYQKLGIMAMDLRDGEAPSGKNLFNLPQSRSKPEIDKVMDSLNKRFGLGTIHLLSCGQSVDWMNKSDHKTPAYTTNWKTLVQVKAK